jgi:glycosyltransferase involved in cell wall biosynthesis
MRVTIVLPFVNLTGGIRLLLDFANWLHDNGHHVTVVYPLWPYRFHFTRRQQFQVFRQELGRDIAIPWFHLRCRLVRVPRIVDAYMPPADVILFTAWPTAYSVASLDASRGQKVHILFHHEAGTGPEHRIERTYALPSYRVSFASNVRDSLQSRFGCRIHDIVPAGIDASRFFPDGQPFGDTVLMLYHNDPRKGAGDGLAALTTLRLLIPSLRVRMCGTVIPQWLPPWVEFQFHPSDAELRRLYSTSTALLYPSRDEGFGLPPLEAMACGCAVVTTAVGAVTEFAVHRHNAFVVAPRDIGAMVSALAEVLSNAPLRASITAAAHETAREYELTRVAPQFAAVLERIATRPLPCVLSQSRV